MIRGPQQASHWLVPGVGGDRGSSPGRQSQKDAKIGARSFFSVAVADSMSCQAWQPEPGLFSVAAVIAVTSPLCPPSFPDEDTEVHRGHLVSRLSWLIGCAVSIQTQIDITPKDVEISLKFSRGQKPHTFAWQRPPSSDY